MPTCRRHPRGSISPDLPYSLIHLCPHWLFLQTKTNLSEFAFDPASACGHMGAANTLVKWAIMGEAKEPRLGMALEARRRGVCGVHTWKSTASLIPHMIHPGSGMRAWYSVGSWPTDGLIVSSVFLMGACAKQATGGMGARAGGRVAGRAGGLVGWWGLVGVGGWWQGSWQGG